MKKPTNKNILIITTFLVLAVVLLLIFLLMGILPKDEGDPAEDPIVVTLVYAYQNSKWSSCIEDVVRKFEADHPGIDIQYEICYEDTVYEDMLYKLAARDELGDIVQLKEPYAWATSGLIAPLPREITENVVTVCTVDGLDYAVCALGTTTGIVYNAEMFDSLGLEVPNTYNEFISLCEALKQSGMTPLGASGKDLWHFEYWLNHFLRTDILSEEPDFLKQCSERTRTWSDPLVTQMLTHIYDLFAMDFVDANWQITPDGSLAFRIAEGEVAMVFSGPWLMDAVYAVDSDAQLGWFYVPDNDGNAVAGESLDVFWSVTAACAEDERKYNAAVEFLEYFYSNEVYDAVCKGMSGFSTLKDDVADYDNTSASFIDTARINAGKRISAYVGDENTPPGFEKKLLTLLYRMCLGELSVEETQMLAAQAWDECLTQEEYYEE